MYMIKLPVFEFTITQHSTLVSHACSMCSTLFKGHHCINMINTLKAQKVNEIQSVKDLLQLHIA